MNKCIFVGNVARDPEVSISPATQTKVARTSLALNRGKDKDGNDRGADFVRLVAFGSRADFMERFMKKGIKFAVECHVVTSSYQDRDGVTKFSTDFIVDSYDFCEKSGHSAPQDAPAGEMQEGGFMSIPDGIDEELPFN